jgi:hypothetical protein
MIITKFTDFNIDSPNWFINVLKEEFSLRDLKGITNNRFEHISISGQHPFIQLVNDLLENENSVKNTSILPCISVSENDENQEIVTIGEGFRGAQLIDTDILNYIETNYSDYKKRNKEGILTNNQIETIRTHINSGKKLKMLVYEYFLRTSVFVSLWANTYEEYQILSKILRSILYDIRLKMISRKAVDISITSNKGLVNTNFGKIIYGQETEIQFLNGFRNYIVTDEEFLENFDVITSGNYKNNIDNNSFVLYDIG